MCSAKVTCDFCGVEGDFLKDSFNQVVLAFEAGSNWNGDLAIACKECDEKYQRGTIEKTQDGREGLSKETRESVAAAFEYANEDPLFGAYLFKPKLPEGDRWVVEERLRKLEHEDKKQREEEFKKRTGMTFAEYKTYCFQQRRNSDDPCVRAFAILFGDRKWSTE
jgi:hypothetical protein